MTELEKMKAGLLYDGADPELREYQMACRAAKEEFDALPKADPLARFEALKSLVGSTNGFAMIQDPFYTDFGKHIHLGEWSFVNAGATFLDSATVTLGDFVAVGPNVQFITANHPVPFAERTVPRPGNFPPFSFMIEAKPIKVERGAWIGAGTIILPGVTIGEEAVVGAGSVVTKDVPARTVAVGNPARVIREIDT